MYQKKGKKISYVIDDKEYYEFLSKFRGCLLFRGKSSLSYKLLDSIFYFYKSTFGIESDYLFKRSLSELMPFLSYRNIRLGKKFYPVPFVLKKHRRFMLLIDWIIRSNKNKSNVRGFKLDDINKVLYDALFKQGPIFETKKEHFKKSLEYRHILTKEIRKKKGKVPANKLLSQINTSKIVYNYPNNTVGKLFASIFFSNWHRKDTHKRYIAFRRSIKKLYLNKKITKKQKLAFLLNFIRANKKFINYRYLKNNNLFLDSFYEKKKKVNNTI